MRRGFIYRVKKKYFSFYFWLLLVQRSYSNLAAAIPGLFYISLLFKKVNAPGD